MLVLSSRVLPGQFYCWGKSEHRHRDPFGILSGACADIPRPGLMNECMNEWMNPMIAQRALISFFKETFQILCTGVS